MKPVLKKSHSLDSHVVSLRGKQRCSEKKQQKSLLLSHSNIIEIPKSRSGDKKECDFYANPTFLSRLILHQKYSSAMRRLAKHPREAEIWVCRARSENSTIVSVTSSSDHGSIAEKKQTLIPFPSVFNPRTECNSSHYSNKEHDNIEYSYRQLPIHAACQNLSLCGGHVHHHTNSRTALALRKELEALISQLIVAYPAGCKTADHQGTYPLHACVQNAASTEIITLLLTAAPHIILQTDARGRTPLDWNRITVEVVSSSENKKMMWTSKKHRERIHKLISKGPEYWEFVRQQAMRKRREKKALTAAAQHSQNKNGRAIAEGKQFSQQDDTSTIWTESVGKEKSIDSTVTTSEKCSGTNPETLSMYQMNHRCLMLEQYLTESIVQTHFLQQNLLRAKQKVREISDKYNGPKQQANTKQHTFSSLNKRDPYQTKGSDFVLYNRKLENGETHPAAGSGNKTMEVFSIVESLKSQNLELQEQINGLEDLVGQLLWKSTTSIPTSSSSSSSISSAMSSFQQNQINPLIQKSPVTGAISNRSASFPSVHLSSLTSSSMDIVIHHPQRPKGKMEDLSFVSVPERHFKRNSSLITPPSDDREPIAPQNLFRESIIQPPISSPIQNSRTKLGDDDDEEYYYYTDDELDDQYSVNENIAPQKIVTTVKNAEESENSEHSALSRTEMVEYDDDESVDSILAQAEIINGAMLSSKLVNAWKAISLPECADNLDVYQLDRQENEFHDKSKKS
jgi:hypothetical protein